MISPFNLFRPVQQTTQASAPAPAPAPAQQTAPAGVPNPQGQAAAVNAGNTASNSPMDAFKDMWKTPTTDGANQPQDPFSSPLFATDPKQIAEAASKMDFISQVPQELMQKAMSGNDPQAFMQVINSVAQQSLAAALQVTTGTVEQAGTKIGDRFKKSLPGQFRDLQIDSQKASNPILEHPAAQPMLKMVRQQIKMMNPDMQPAQIQMEAEKYLANFSSALNENDPNRPKPAVDPNNQDQDWLAWSQSQSS